MTDPTPVLAQIEQRLARIEQALLLPGRADRWQPLEVAAEQLGYGSGQTLRRAIRDGRIPSRYVTSERTASGQRRRTRVDVEGYRASLRRVG